VTSLISLLSTAHHVALLNTQFSLSHQSTISLANHTGSVFIVFAIASTVPYLLIIACCPSSVKKVFNSQILVSSGFVAHLTFAEIVFKKLHGAFTTILAKLGLFAPINVSGASTKCSQKFAV